MDKKTQKHQLSFADAFTFLKKFRYKPRNEWTKEERTIFKICNFIVLSKKRINKTFLAFSSLAKLSDKSHYNYNEIDILKIKDLLLQNLEQTLQKFNKNIRLFKEEDINIVQEHLKKLKDENYGLLECIFFYKYFLNILDYLVQKWSDFKQNLKLGTLSCSPTL